MDILLLEDSAGAFRFTDRVGPRDAIEYDVFVNAAWIVGVPVVTVETPWPYSVRYGDNFVVAGTVSEADGIVYLIMVIEGVTSMVAVGTCTPLEPFRFSFPVEALMPDGNYTFTLGAMTLAADGVDTSKPVEAHVYVGITGTVPRSPIPPQSLPGTPRASPTVEVYRPEEFTDIAPRRYRIRRVFDLFYMLPLMNQ
jgi:hypothetical protein